MSRKNPGNWFSNADDILNKTQNLDSDGLYTKANILQIRDSGPYVEDGAISLNYSLAVLLADVDTTEMTLADGVLGQEITIVCSNATNTCNCDFSIPEGSATVTFTAAGQGIKLVYVDGEAIGAGGWHVVGLYGATVA